MFGDTNNYNASAMTGSAWMRSIDKVFENALVLFPEETPDRWRLIADLLPGMSPEDMMAHYDALVQDVQDIESGRIELPCYPDDSSSLGCEFECMRTKGTAWTKKEHRLFLLGLETYGKGDWRSISRKVVVTRTPTQVASHAQKFFLRQFSKKKGRKRKSIHDITTTADTQPIPPPAIQIQVAQIPDQGDQLSNQEESIGFGNSNYNM